MLYFVEFRSSGSISCARSCSVLCVVVVSSLFVVFVFLRWFVGVVVLCLLGCGVLVVWFGRVMLLFGCSFLLLLWVFFCFWSGRAVIVFCLVVSWEFFFYCLLYHFSTIFFLWVEPFCLVLFLIIDLWGVRLVFYLSFVSVLVGAFGF